MTSTVVSLEEITKIFNEECLSMISYEDFENALKVADRIQYVQLSLEDFNDEVKNSLLQAQALFIIVETLEDEHIDKKYGQLYELLSDSMDESKVVFIDTKDVSEVSDEPLHIIFFGLS